MLAGTETGTLLYSEAVLFVGDGECKPGKVQTVAEQGMGADDKIEGTGFESRNQFTFFFSSCGTGQQADSDSEPSENAAQRSIMLFCKYLSRRHEGGGIPGLNTLPDQRSCHQSLTTADVAL